MKYAIIEDGGKQYRVAVGGTIDVDRFDSEAGDELDLDRVLVIGDDEQTIIGTPYIDGAKVAASVVGPVKGDKIVVFKYKPKKRYRVKTGHRQHYVRLRIDAIEMA